MRLANLSTRISTAALLMAMLSPMTAAAQTTLLGSPLLLQELTGARASDAELTSRVAALENAQLFLQDANAAGGNTRQTRADLRDVDIELARLRARLAFTAWESAPTGLIAGRALPTAFTGDPGFRRGGASPGVAPDGTAPRWLPYPDRTALPW